MNRNFKETFIGIGKGMFKVCLSFSLNLDTRRILKSGYELGDIDNILLLNSQRFSEKHHKFQLFKFQ